MIYVPLTMGFYALIKKLQDLSLLLKNVFMVGYFYQLASLGPPSWLHASIFELVLGVEEGGQGEISLRREAVTIFITF